MRGEGRNDYDRMLQSRFTSVSFTAHGASANATTSKLHLELPARWGNRPCRVSWRRSWQLGSSRVSFVTRSRLRGNTIVIVSIERLCFRSNEGRSSFVNGAWLRFPGNLNPECRSIVECRFWIMSFVRILFE